MELAPFDAVLSFLLAGDVIHPQPALLVDNNVRE